MARSTGAVTIMIAAAAMLSACEVERAGDTDANRAETNTGTTRAASGDRPATTARNVSIRLPGFDASFNLPDGVMAGSEFDIEGVGLYPGARLTTFDLDADRDRRGDGAVVRIGFDAPAAPDIVGQWFASEFARNKVAVTQSGTVLTGTTGDGDRFRIELSPGGGGTTGQIAIIDGKSAGRGW